MKKDKTLDPIKKLAESVDTKVVNSILSQTDLKDFEMTKQTIMNIAEWCLNGNSDTEIRQKLSLNKHQWDVLTTVCPTLLIAMEQSRTLAEVVLAGSLFQTAVGGKIVRKQVPIKKKIYNEEGKVIGEENELIWVEEELPPNPLLLKFLAEKKLNEKLGDNANSDKKDVKDIVENLSDEDLAKLEKMKDLV